MSDTTTTLTDALTVQRRMFAAVGRGDMQALRELLHPDYRYTASDGVEHPGPQAAIDVAERYVTAFPDLRIEELRSWSPSPEVAVMEVRYRGTHTGPLGDAPPTGRAVTGLGCNIAEVRDGRLWREHEFFDQLPMLEQLGLAGD
ncbi:ester cyclase [Miltoncostaea marina]|uniref:ester cyclase n=1 Tax=Miltoncostaea marina TaxID=2843215 RepID=UPI001C3C9E23|nr:ester cyclase [Miltoncostaea marina]